MAYKSTRNRGKRSKKSNRKTHKQKGGNRTYLMLGLIFLLLLQMNIIVQVDAKFMDGVIDKPLNEERKQALQQALQQYEKLLKKLKEDNKSKISLKRFTAIYAPEVLKSIANANYINAALTTPKDIQDVQNKIDKIENELMLQSMEESKKYLYLTTNEMEEILGPYVLATNYNKLSTSLLELKKDRTWSNYLTRKTVDFPIHKMWFDNKHYYAIHIKKSIIVIRDVLKWIDDVELKERLEFLLKILNFFIEPLEEEQNKPLEDNIELLEEQQNSE